jgi:hypothetical protein
MTNIGPFPRMTLRFDRLCSGHYHATTGETAHRWSYDITRVTARVWRVAQLRLQRGRGLIVIDTRDVATLKSGMQWCENAARNDGRSRSLAAACWPVHGASATVCRRSKLFWQLPAS